MAIWAIADLHLSQARVDRRERFAARWKDHSRQIATNWMQSVQPQDVVLLPGDLSTARNHREVQPDLDWLDRLPGTKVLSAGNHDAWWNGVDQIRPMLRHSMLAVDGNAVSTHGVIFCGSLGAAVAEDHDAGLDATSQKEFQKLAQALSDAERVRVDDRDPLYVLWHYPPFDQHGRPGPWVSLMESHNVTACVYGHLHIQAQWSLAVQGMVRNIRYHCVAADALGFRPIRVDRVASRPRR